MANVTADGPHTCSSGRPAFFDPAQRFARRCVSQYSRSIFAFTLSHVVASLPTSSASTTARKYLVSNCTQIVQINASKGSLRMLTLSASNSVTLLWENPSRNAGFLDTAPTSPSSPSPRVAPPLALGRFAPDSGAALLREHCCESAAALCLVLAHLVQALVLLV